MMRPRLARALLGALLAIVLVGGVAVVATTAEDVHRVHVTAYFANSNGIFPGDEVRILGVPVGKIDSIQPESTRVKITFWYDGADPVPSTADAVILSPSLVTARAIQLTPPYTGGPALRDGAVISQDRTAVPVEFDDFRQQLQRLTDSLAPTQPGGLSTLGSFVSTTAANLRGQGSTIRASLIRLSQAVSALGDHSADIFGTVKNISTLVSALHDSTDLMRQLNQNLASVTSLLANDPDEVGNAVHDVNAAVGDVRAFVADNRETLGTTSDKLASLTTVLNQSADDLKQTLHVAPNSFQNFVNVYQPSQGALTGALSLNNFANPITFLCGAIQAASRLGAEQSAKLCAQYLAPIIKNRQVNFLPLGENLFVGEAARPNEITYSEDWMRPDYVPPPAADGNVQPGSGAPPPTSAALPAEAPTDGAPPTVTEANPADGLTGLMTPPGGGR